MIFLNSYLSQETTVWRLTKETFISEAFSGKGAKLYPGRWNNKGVNVVYTAGSESLAILEMLVQANPTLPYWKIEARLPADLLVTTIDTSKLPKSWRESPPRDEVRNIGSMWVEQNLSSVLMVPSSIVEQELNYLLNPLHTDFSRISIGIATESSLDPRLKR